VPELTRLATALDQVAAAAEERDRAAAALMDKEARLSLALEAGALGAWEMDPRTGAVIRSPQHDALFGYDRPVAAWTYRFMLRHVLREDRPKVEAIFRRAVAASAPLHAECRIRRAGDGEVRWLEATGAPHRGPDGRVKYLGVIADVTERRRAEEQLRLVAGELNHRVKNSLAAVQSIAAQTLRWPEDDAPGAAAARAAFEARLLALARSHDLLTREGWSGAGRADVAARALAPHAAAKGTAPAGEATETRVRIAGPPVRLSPRSAIPLAMALHELATDAARHGALSVPQGRVAVTWSLVPKDPGEGEPRLLLRWRESGGPALAGPPARRGFGSRLLERGLALELCGTVRMDFAPGGLVCEIEAPLSIVAPSDAVAAVLAAMTAPGAATAAPPRMPAVAAAAAR
jgi:PAS domain S-box-containing protein